MGKWTDPWISALSTTPSGGSEYAEQSYPGERLGLPASGPGSVAGFARRAAALILDVLLAALVAGLFTAPELPRNWSLLAWLVLTVVPLAIFGATTGMIAFGIRAARVDGHQFVGVPRAVLRTVLLFFVVPAVIWNADQRGLHDRAAGTVVVRTR